MKVLDICSGIGGFTLAHLISGGFETVAFCEINEYCQQVLRLRFPGVPIINDIRAITTESLAELGIPAIDGIIGGPPCQPFSQAGKQEASEDGRNLWPEVARIIRLLHPRWAVLENVPNLLSVEDGDYFRLILWEFSQMGYICEWGVLPAASVGAVHLRERLWIIAYTKGSGRHSPRREQLEGRANTASVGSSSAIAQPERWTAIAQPEFCGSNARLSAELDRHLLQQRELTDWLGAATVPSFSRLTLDEVGALSPDCQREYRQLLQEYYSARRQHKERLAALGNAIVPQVAAKVFDRLKEILESK